MAFILDSPNAYELLDTQPERLIGHLDALNLSEHFRALRRMLQSECDAMYRLLSKTDPTNAVVIARLQGRIEGFELVLNGPERYGSEAQEVILQRGRETDDEPA